MEERLLSAPSEGVPRCVSVSPEARLGQWWLWRARCLPAGSGPGGASFAESDDREVGEARLEAELRLDQFPDGVEVLDATTATVAQRSQ